MKKELIDWNIISFITRGKHRRKILELLESPKTPTKVKEETKIHFNTVSKTIGELEKRELIKCLTPNQKLSRYYQITSKGKGLLPQLSQL